MVAKLPLPIEDSLNIVEAIIAERVHHRDFFTSMEAEWKKQIEDYRLNAGDPNSIPSMDLSRHISQERIDEEEGKEPRSRESSDATQRLIQRRKKSLIGLYQPDTDKDLYSILETMRDKHRLRFCPCCGEAGKPGTLDHYLPKSKYPELSVVVENLTPMCTDCQELKDNNVLNLQGEKLFIHPYYDSIDTVLIELDIRPPFANPSGFIAMVPNTISNDLRSLVERHIEEIEFVERFEEFCSLEYTDLLSIIAEEKEDPQRKPFVETITSYLVKAERKSPNYWEAIFYRGVLNCPQLLHFFETSDLSEYI